MKNLLFYILLLPSVIMAQSIKSISPLSAEKYESVVLTIVGKNTAFKTGVNTVKLVNLDTINSTSVICLNDTTLQAVFTFDDNLSSMYSVVVFNSQLNTTLNLYDTFVLSNPTTKIDNLVSLTPSIASQGDNVEIMAKFSNTNFTQIKPSSISLMLIDSSTVFGNGLLAFSITVVDNLTLKANFRFSYTDRVGKYDLVCVAANSRSKNVFTLKEGNFPPKIVSITPDSLHILDSALITVKVENFSFVKDSSLIFFTRNVQGVYEKKLYTGQIEYIDNSTVKFSISPLNDLKADQYNMVVSNSSNSEVVFKNALSLLQPTNPPSITSFTPTSALQGETITINVKGKNTHFLSGPTNNSIKLVKDKIELLSSTFNAVNDSVLQGKFVFDNLPVPLGKYSLSTYDYMDGSLSLKDSFTLNPGNNFKLLSVIPNSVTQGHTNVKLVIKHTKGFFSNFSIDKIRLIHDKVILEGPVYLMDQTDTTSSVIFNFPTNNEAVGIYDLVITERRYGTKFILPAALTVGPNPIQPSLLSISPDNGSQPDSVVVRINGVHTHFKSVQVNEVYLISSDSLNFRINSNSVEVINDSTINVRFIFNMVYNPSIQFNVAVENQIDGKVELKNAFKLINSKKVIDIDPKEASQGDIISISIKGNSQAFTLGNNSVKLINSTNANNLIVATSVNYLTDSSLAASFSFNSSHLTGLYYVNVGNQKYNLTYNGFHLKPGKSNLKSVTPLWASQTDTATLSITGINTHFDSADSIWLENKFGIKLKPLSILVVNDTLTQIKIAFSKNDLAMRYSIYLKSKNDNAVMILKDEFTVAGKNNSVQFVKVAPDQPNCYSNSDIIVYTNDTHLLSDANAIFLFSRETSETFRASTMKIINDKAISGNFNIEPCGFYDILITGKQNYLFNKALFAKTVTINVDNIVNPSTIQLYPNPSDGIFTLHVNENMEHAMLNIYDIHGREIIKIDKIESLTQLNLESYSNGIYFMKLVKDNNCKTMKIIKN